MKTNNTRAGFTLVELLVVISIIAMLAGLLLPAINAARENGRRAQCISNQRQVAFAVINHDHTRGFIPPLRGALVPAAYWNVDAPPLGVLATTVHKDLTELTWIGFLLPFMEQNTAWQLISSGTMGSSNAATLNAENLYQLPLPVMQCRSSGITPGESRINYVANAGPLNWDNTDIYEFAKNTAAADRPRRDAKLFTVFFDHMTREGVWGDSATTAGTVYPRCETKMSMENISKMDGTSTTILLSENEDAGHWIWHSAKGTGTTSVPIASHIRVTDPVYHVAGVDIEEAAGIAEIESLVAFCYPITDMATIENGETVTYTVLSNPDNNIQPLFINEGRSNLSVEINEPTRKARPSSGHPGVVVAAFCDQSTRVLRDDMDKQLFVRLCRPGSGVILNPKDLEF